MLQDRGCFLDLDPGEINDPLEVGHIASFYKDFKASFLIV